MAESKDGIIVVSDGTKLKLKVAIVDAREAGFSPFGGVNIVVRPMAGLASLKVPQRLRDEVSDKPYVPERPEPPRDGWELMEIKEFSPAYAEEVIETSKGKFRVRVVAEPVMVARNMKYKTAVGEPYYWANWVFKISWRPAEEKR